MPEIASRQHVRDICGVVERALADAGVDWPDLDAIAVTQGPGLVGSLLVGVSFAKAAAAALGKPIVAVHHLAGHIESIFLEHGPIPLPAAVLVVSGGHTSLYLVPEPGVYRLIGRTRDDAAGEAYDKVARLARPRLSGRTGHRPVGEARARQRRGSAARRGSPTPIAIRRRPTWSLRRFRRRRSTSRSSVSPDLKTAVVRHLSLRGVPVATGLTVPTDAGPLDAAGSRRSLRVASSAWWSSRWSIARSRRRAGSAQEHRHRRRRLGQQPAPPRRRRAR